MEGAEEPQTGENVEHDKAASSEGVANEAKAEEVSGEGGAGQEESSEGSELLALAERDAAFVEEAWGELAGEGEDEEGEAEAGEGGPAPPPPVPAAEEEEEELYEEEPPDPTAPYNLTDSSEALKAPFELNAEQLAEATELWNVYQDYTPAYTDLDNYVTEVELNYMLKSLNLQTFTPEQLQELIAYCVRPPNENNHVNYQQFIRIVTIRQRDMPQEEELRLALEIFDPEHTGIIDRDYFREVLNNHGRPVKTTEVLIKEVDMANDGTLGLEDIVGTICIDLNRDDIVMLYEKIYPPEERNDENLEELTATGANIGQPQ